MPKKRKKLKQKEPLPTLASVPRKPARGKMRMAELQELTKQEGQDPSAQFTALDARARAAGKMPEYEEPEIFDEMTPKQIKKAEETQMAKYNTALASVRSEMRSPALGEEAGRAIHSALQGKAAKEAWRAYEGLTASMWAYSKTVLGVYPFPKSMKFETLPERFETRPDDRPDLRDEEQRQRDTVNSWMRWNGWIDQLAVQDRSAIWDHVRRGVVLHTYDGLTVRGTRFCEAMDKLAQVVDRKR